MNPLLFGHNPDERIVAVHQHGDSAMRVYTRTKSGVSHEDAPFYPFLFLADRRLIEGFTRKHWVRQLEGNGFYKYLCVFQEWSSLWEAVRHILETYNHTALTKVSSHTDLDLLHLYTDPVTQYLLQTGRTLFKGMTFDDLHRMQLDIETYTSSSFRFSSASRQGDRIILIALSDHTGWKHLLNGKEFDEQEMLLELIRIINERDPDVLEGHNILNFDLPYILKRCELHGVRFTVGRDGSVPTSFDTVTSFGERTYDYTITGIAGRHVIDTLMLVQAFDMVKRNMESHGLKYAAKYFGIAPTNRTYIAGNAISWHWDHDPEPVLAYALDDVVETCRLSMLLSGSSFYLTQILPFAYDVVARIGAAAKIEALLVREYLRHKSSIPKPREGMQTTGGYTEIFLTGIVGPVLHADVESLYPSIMLMRGIFPSSDERGVFLQLLRELTEMRLAAKRGMRTATSPEERSKLDAMQTSFKILINSFYGYLGFGRGLFNDYSKADEVTRTGQEILKMMINFIRSRGGTVVEVDTDGILFVPPESVRSEENIVRFITDLSNATPEGISVALDGHYAKMLSYKKKNYALLRFDGEVIIKGSSLMSRSIEQFGRRYIRECIQHLLHEDIGELHRTYLRYREAIIGHAFDIRDFARTENLKDPLEVYEKEVNSGLRTRSAAYEVALKMASSHERVSRVTYYVTGTGADIPIHGNCKDISEWDENFPDENVDFYLRRLDEYSAKFKPFFRPQDYRGIFSAEDLFPFDPQGVRPIIESVQTETEPSFSPNDAEAE